MALYSFYTGLEVKWKKRVAFQRHSTIVDLLSDNDDDITVVEVTAFQRRLTLLGNDIITISSFSTKPHRSIQYFENA